MPGLKMCCNSTLDSDFRFMKRNFFLSLFCLCALQAPVCVADNSVAGEVPRTGRIDRVYQLDYEVSFVPAEGSAHVAVTVRQPRNLLRSLSFEYDPTRYDGFSGDGVIEDTGSRLTWEPPGTGGTLKFSVVINHERGEAGRYDSLMRNHWAVFRGDDLLPPARIRALKGAASQARLRMSGPSGWSFISAYRRSENDPDWFEVDRTDRKFERPVGWMAAGNIGVRWGDRAGVRFAIAGPMGQGIRYSDIKAFLRWNLPTLVNIFPDFPKRILLVSAGDPMWRGGLSGPGSLYIHADRPLISANGTSTMLHELVHLAQGYRAVPGQDWIVEALAEFYTLEIMRRSGTLSGMDYKQGLEKLESWAGEEDILEADESSGPRTAKGVAVMQALDDELREMTAGRYSLDDVAGQLSLAGAPVSIEQLRQVAELLAGQPLESISPQRIDTD